MQYTKPLTELIAELQKIADNHPGIQCTLDDYELGLQNPTLQVLPVHINNNHCTIVDTFTRDMVTRTAKLYSEKSAKEMWETLGDDKSPWKNFEEFEHRHTLIKEKALQDLQNFDKANLMVILKA
jgi:hypothetical protein